MRQYTVQDVFTFVDLLSVLGKDHELRNILKQSSETDTEAESKGIEIVLYILNRCFVDCKDRLIKWFASLNEMTEEEFLNQPPEKVLETIEEIATRTESRDFFSRAFALFQKMGSS